VAYSFTKSRNSILLAKYVTGFCTSRSTGRRGAETVCATFRSRAAPPPGCTLPPLTPPPSFPAPGNTPDPSASFLHPPLRSRAAPFAQVAPRPARTPFVPPPFDSWVAPPSFLAPSPRALPLACGPPPAAWPPLRGPPIARTPIPSALPACTQKGWRACGRGGARGTGATRVEGTARAREGGRHHLLCLPSMCAKGEAG